MAQSGNFTKQYLDTITSESGDGGTQDGDLPLPLASAGAAATGAVKNIASSADDDTPDPKDFGKAAATRDFQTAAGEGWEYDHEAMHNQITRLEDIRDTKLANLRQKFDSFSDKADSPGDEEVSHEYVDIVNSSLASHTQQAETYHEYLTAYIERLRDVDRAYQDEDEDAKDELLSKDV